MNRSTVFTLLIGLLVIQGSVAGVVGNDANASANGTNATTEESSVTEHPTEDNGSVDMEAIMNSATNNSSEPRSESDNSSNGTSETTTASETTTTEEESTTTETATTTTPTETTTESTTQSETTTETTTTTPTETESSDSTRQTEDSESESSTTGGETSTTTTDGQSGGNGAATQPSGQSESQSPEAGGAQSQPTGQAAAGADSTSAQTASTAGSQGGSAAQAGAERSSGGQAGSAQAGGAQAGGAQTGGAPSGAAPSGAGGQAGTGAQTGGSQAGAGAQAGGTQAGGAQAGGNGAQTASPDAEFNVTGVDDSVAVGGSGTVAVTIENTGEDATDAVVDFQSPSGDLLFGQSPTTSRYVGEWDEGETRTIEVTMQATPSADTAEYPVRATVSYEDDDGNAAQSAPLTFGVTPGGEQSFSLGSVDGDLSVGDSGTITGTITNEGPETATDAVLTVGPNASRDVIPRQTQVVLGTLDPDESEGFELPVIVDSEAEPGLRQLPLTVQYYDDDGNPMQSSTLNARVEIDEERDDFAIESVEPAVEAGEEGTLSVTLTNTGGNVTDATVSTQSLSGGILFGQSANATRFVEDWDAGDTRTFEYDVRAAEGATGATYPLQTSISYDDSDGDQGQAGPLAFGVTPGESVDDFSVVETTSNVQVGDEGPISVTLENTGANASEATVSLQSLTGDITFGRTANATQFVGDWPAGAQRTITFNATASNTTDVQSYPFQASVSYSDGDGDTARGGPFTIGVTPQPEQAFDLDNAASTLRVGDEGNVTAQITNEGPQDVQNAVVQLVTQGENINPQETEFAVGNLPAGETANVSFPVEVTDSAEAGQRQFSFVVEYDNQNGDPRRSGTLDTQVPIEPQRDEFTIEPANASVGAGSSETMTLNVTNNRDSVVRNVNAKAFVDAPLSISSDEAYISRLGPGETKQIAFDVSAGGDASEGQYPLSVDFQYDTADGESKLSQTYEVPVETTASEGGGLFSSLGLTIGLVALLVVIGVGWVWSRR
nr:NEW3 domain-containing protein [Halococcus saccharolyticus]